MTCACSQEASRRLCSPRAGLPVDGVRPVKPPTFASRHCVSRARDPAFWKSNNPSLAAGKNDPRRCWKHLPGAGENFTIPYPGAFLSGDERCVFTT